MTLTNKAMVRIYLFKFSDVPWIKLYLGKQLPIIALNKRYLHYHARIEGMVNKQIKAEQQASQDYLNIAVSLLNVSKSLVGAGGFFMKMYYEELEHMQRLIHYQLLRGGTPLICGLEPPKQNKDITLLDAFKQGLSMEKKNTELLVEGVQLADEIKDYQYEDFLTSVFLAEQMQSIHEFATHVAKLTALNNDANGLYQYDLELEKKYPYKYKVKSTVK